MVSRMRLVLAQILAHRHARLRLMRVSTFRPLPTENAAIAHGLRNSRSSPKNHPELCLPVPQKPELRSYVNKLAGTFNWRKVAGTERLSNHSFATAIDLNVDKAAYWRRQSPTQMEVFSRKSWPTEIIETFERHGFIWGGKWWHFDTMHFEYRPEIIAYAKSGATTVPEIKSVH